MVGLLKASRFQQQEKPGKRCFFLSQTKSRKILSKNWMQK